MTQELLFNVFQIIVLIYSVVLHEVAHGLAARSMGDMTAHRLGRLTLNPIKHMDLFGSFVLPLLSKLTTGFMFGYAKPVPYEPGNLSDKAYGPAKVAIAGPAVNFLLALGAGMIIRFGADALPAVALGLLQYIVWINIILAVFNLMPIPPLDGHWLLMTFLPARFLTVKIILYRYQWIFLIFFLFVVFPLLAPLMNWLFGLLTGRMLL